MRPSPFLFSLALTFAVPAPVPASGETGPANWESLAAAVHDAYGAADPGRLSAALDAAATVDLDKALVLASTNALEGVIVAGHWRPSPGAFEAAFRTTLKAPASSYQEHLLLGIVNAWVKNDPPAVQAVIESVPESPGRADLNDSFRQALLRFRPGDALDLALAERGKPGAIKVREAAHALSRTDRESALKYLAEIPTSDPLGRLELVKSIANHWSQSAPEAAGEWGKTLAMPAEREVAFEEVLYAWSTTDREAASRWALALKPGSSRDAALRAHVFQTAHRAPADAFRAALKISEPNLQDTALYTVLTEWGAQDAPAARAAIEAEPTLTDKKKDELKTDLP